ATRRWRAARCDSCAECRASWRTSSASRAACGGCCPGRRRQCRQAALKSCTTGDARLLRLTTSGAKLQPPPFGRTAYTPYLAAVPVLAIAVAVPVARLPAVAVALALPVPLDPDVAPVAPLLIAGDPDEARTRQEVDLLLRRRRWRGRRRLDDRLRGRNVHRPI